MAPLRILAASGWPARAAFGLAGLSALAVQLWPVETAAPPEPMPPARLVAPEGSALHRPLFDPSRQAWTGAGSRDLILRADPVPPILVLRGLRHDGAEARAFIDDGSGDTTWLAPGDGRGDWRITAIGTDRVTVFQRGRSVEAELLGQPATLRPAPWADRPLELRP